MQYMLLMSAVEETAEQDMRDERVPTFSAWLSDLNWRGVLPAHVGLPRNWDLAEESAQEASAVALTAWGRDGVRRQPGAWLITTARSRAIDRIRRDQVGAAKLREVAALFTSETSEPGGDDEVDSGSRDDRLRRIYTGCDAALAFEAQVRLALRALCGL